MRELAAAVALCALLAACGEPPIGIDIPDRADGQQVLDTAGILDGDEMEEALDTVRSNRDLDIVALAYETEAANCGEAFRAGGALLEAWDADIAVVAVARLGDFRSTGEDRRRCLGIRPRNEFAVPGSVREEIVEVRVPPLARENDWQAAFGVAVDGLVGAML